MKSESITGNVRYRLYRTFTGRELLVLEVEVEHGEGSPDVNGMPEYLAGKQWRDATVRDLVLVQP